MQVERRKYRRFEIPGGTAKIGKAQGFSLLKPFSKSFPLMNACMGGVNILCNRELNTGDNLLLKIHAPGEKSIKISAKVIWTNPVPLSNDVLTGFELAPFGGDRDLNPPEAMNVLRRLYAKYIKS